MKLETILSAMEDAKEESDFCFQVRDVGRGYGKYHSLHRRRLRQYHAFRDRIIRMDAKKSIAIVTCLDCLVRGHWHERRKDVIEKHPYMPEETLKRMMLLENQNAELRDMLEEQDLLLAQWESIDELNRERSQQRLQRIAQLEADNIDLSEEYAKACKRIAELEKPDCH